MPARSQAQRGYLAVHKGPAWMRKHGFDNKGKLPEHTAAAARHRKLHAYMRKHRHG
jgi:hypothetical protein